jgi:iron(III) transport system substrate-binding protein
MENTELFTGRAARAMLASVMASVVTVGLSFSMGAFAQAQPPRPSAAALQSELDALIKGARAEGEVVFYSSATENVAKRVGDAFTAKYGVKVGFTRFPGAQAVLRYSSEAEANTFNADLMFIAGSAILFGQDAIKKGWMDSIPSANLPVVRSGEFPARFVTGPTAIIQIAPWYIAYNSDKLKGADIPKDWPDLLKPQYRGQILLPDPRSSDSYLDMWALLIDKYGESFFSQLRAQNPRWYPSGVPAVQALGAGEGAIEFPAVPAQIQATQAKGAPLGMVNVDHTVGVEMQVLLTARGKAKHPNAARLLANYAMSPEGNKVFNDDPGSSTVYDSSKLPKQYESPKTGTVNRKAEIVKVLGLN